MQVHNSPVRVKDDPIDWCLVLYFVVGTVAFYALSYPIAYFIHSVAGDWNTHLQLLDSAYYRYFVHTQYLPV